MARDDVHVSRHELFTMLIAFAMTMALACIPLSAQDASTIKPQSKAKAPKTFRVWVFSDAHVGTDKKQRRESLAEALRQSESESGFDWDIALDLGDVSGEQGTPKDAEGEELIHQFSVLTRQDRKSVV